MSTASRLYPITGRSSTGLTCERIPVEELRDQHPYQWTLFILGFAWIKETPIRLPGFPVDDPRLKPAISFMQIGGIHGQPYRRWAGHVRTEADVALGLDNRPPWDTDLDTGGYCQNISFPTWHRPYVMLIEQAIGEYADHVAQQIENEHPEEAGRWIDAAKKLRFPYWDWAEYKVTDAEFQGFPSYFYTDALTVTGLGGQIVRVPNPLSYFQYPHTPEAHGFVDWVNARNQTAFYSQWTRTYRRTGANPAYPPVSNIDDLNEEYTRQVEDIRSKIAQLFSFPDNGDSSSIYDHFASVNRLSHGGKNMTVGSLEGVHNAVHALTGGNGNMGSPDYAGFDPFFYFHHSTIDRILALWEWCYPEYWMDNGYKKTEGPEETPWTQTYNGKDVGGGDGGPLIPWKHADGTYWTNKQTRFLPSDASPREDYPKKYYTYKEFLGIKVDEPSGSLEERREARARILEFYAGPHVYIENVGHVPLPAEFQSRRGFRLFVIDVTLPQHAFGHSYKFEVSCEDYNAKHEKEKWVGNITIFARGDDSPCEGCAIGRENAPTSQGSISVPPRVVSDIIVRSGIARSTLNKEITSDLIAKALSAKLLGMSNEVLASASAQGGEEVAANKQDADEKFLPTKVTLCSSVVTQKEDDKGNPAYEFAWECNLDLFPPSNWKAECKEVVRQATAKCTHCVA
ncbi:Di-copper centre-containing protein [Paxillus ammoniavirescens]|nr:Di-copper centre-containing protein [Paxillus ammoniavirescens]